MRITAQRLVNGRTEFALQQREADGGWGERLLTRARLFPATATVGRWLASTPLTVRARGAGDDAAGTEVRITAQRLADDRIEFALQEREADGGWGERLLTRARLFPATATVGRWLASTPLTVSLPEPEVSPDTAEDGGSVASDRAALVALYNATRGASWSTSTNWLSDRPLDEWHGVTTNSVGRVTLLLLSDNELTGPIPAELGDLSNLEWLWLSGNELTGPIPAWLGDLSNLEWLNLGDNQLTGPIPAELGDLSNLQNLWLSRNQLTGPIPAELGDPHQSANAGPRQQPVDGAYPGRAGRPHQPAYAGPLVQPVDGADPGRAGRPHQPAYAGPLVQPVDGADPGRAGQPHQPANAVPLGQPVDRVRARRLARCSVE